MPIHSALRRSSGSTFDPSSWTSVRSQFADEAEFDASTAAYHLSHARLAPSIINNEEEIMRVVDAVGSLG